MSARADFLALELEAADLGLVLHGTAIGLFSITAATDPMK